MNLPALTLRNESQIRVRLDGDVDAWKRRLVTARPVALVFPVRLRRIAKKLNRAAGGPGSDSVHLLFAAFTQQVRRFILRNRLQKVGLVARLSEKFDLELVAIDAPAGRFLDEGKDNVDTPHRFLSELSASGLDAEGKRLFRWTVGGFIFAAALGEKEGT